VRRERITGREGLRVSRYSNRVDVGDGTSLLFNGASLCIDEVPREHARRLVEDGDLSFLAPEEAESLLKRGHLTRLTPRRELAAFRKQVRAILGAQRRLFRKPRGATLSFILTYDCNLSCRYCYQKTLPRGARGSRMTAEFVDRFLSRHFPRLFPGVAKKNVLFLLFGGEPLLPSNREAIARILAYARKHSIRVSVATNATMLAAMEDLIGPGRIRNVQVTLDGDAEVHDRQRTSRSGRPTFEAIIAAIHRLIARKVVVFVRVHTHPGRPQTVRRLIRRLEKEGILGHPRVDVYFAPINSFHPLRDSRRNLEAFHRVFQEVAAKTRRPPSLNLDFLKKILGMRTRTVLPKVQFCSLGCDNARIVDFRGDIYDCYEEAGHRDRRIGTVSGGRLEYFPLRKTYSRRHLLHLPECLRCPMALLCGGGCARQALLEKGSIFKPYCLQNREFIAQTLKAYYRNGSPNPRSGKSPGDRDRRPGIPS
jgi:uncharacterized protein